MTGTVIIGAGQAGYQVAESLRHDGYSDDITLIGDEPYVPYQRPPLSKAYLLGKTSAEQLHFRTEAYYREHGIKLLLNTTVTGIDRYDKQVKVTNGNPISYERLVLTTGARVRELPVPGAELEGVCYLRTLDDVIHIQALMEDVRDIVVIGGGFIGLEFAAVASALGNTVTVLEAMDRLMARVVSPVVSGYFAELHASHGVNIEVNTQVSAIRGEGGIVTGVECQDGRQFDAGLVVVGIGVIANDDLASAAGIQCDKGVIVNEYGQSSDGSVFAAGDCAIYKHPYADQPIRLESVQNAVDQARSVASAIADQQKPYTTVPWFWSDQYDVKLQMVGLSLGCDDFVTRGDQTTGKFSVLYFRGDELRAIDSINKPADHILGRKLLAAGNTLSKAQAADSDYPLKSALPD